MNGFKGNALHQDFIRHAVHLFSDRLSIVNKFTYFFLCNRFTAFTLRYKNVRFAVFFFHTHTHTHADFICGRWVHFLAISVAFIIQHGVNFRQHVLLATPRHALCEQPVVSVKHSHKYMPSVSAVTVVFSERFPDIIGCRHFDSLLHLLRTESSKIAVLFAEFH